MCNVSIKADSHFFSKGIAYSTLHDYKISEAFVNALCNFAKTGNPNGKGMSGWEATNISQKKVMMLGEDMPHMGNPSKLKLWYTMLTNKAVGE